MNQNQERAKQLADAIQKRDEAAERYKRTGYQKDLIEMVNSSNEVDWLRGVDPRTVSITGE